MASVVDRATRRWTVEEYHRLAELGVFAPDERVELVDGEILTMSPQNPPHATNSTLAEDEVRRAFKRGWVVRIQKPLDLGEDSEPEPDIAVVRGKARDFLASHPRTAELVVEISDSTLRFDRGPKAAMYARAGIHDYWIVNVLERRLEVHRAPDPLNGVYQEVTIHTEDAHVSPLAAPKSTIAVRDLFA